MVRTIGRTGDKAIAIDRRKIYRIFEPKFKIKVTIETQWKASHIQSPDQFVQMCVLKVCGRKVLKPEQDQ